jgi:hypothetical protein
MLKLCPVPSRQSSNGRIKEEHLVVEGGSCFHLGDPFLVVVSTKKRLESMIRSIFGCILCNR